MEQLDTFLDNCKINSVDTIKIVLECKGVERPEDNQETVVVPCYALYEGYVGRNLSILERTTQGKISYGVKDTEFERPIQGLVDIGNPWERFTEFGLIHAHYCQQEGFNTSLHTSFHPYNDQRTPVLFTVNKDLIEPQEVLEFILF